MEEDLVGIGVGVDSRMAAGYGSQREVGCWKKRKLERKGMQKFEARGPGLVYSQREDSFCSGTLGAKVAERAEWGLPNKR